MTDWRIPENRREAFQRSYTHSLTNLNFPGMVYSMLPAIAEAFDLDEDGRAWLAWLNGNTQNVVTSMLLLEEAPTAIHWSKAVDFWNANFKALEWDTDRRHQKSKFGEATEDWFMDYGFRPANGWRVAGEAGWEATWAHAKGMPYFGRLSAWSGLEFARILLPAYVPDMGSFFLEDKAGSRSHRNGLAVVAGYEGAENWDAGTPDMMGVVPELEDLAESLLREAETRNASLGLEESHREGVAMYSRHPLVSRLTLESALCTYKSWHKPNRRYPNVYADMMYQRIKKAEARFGRSLDLLWEIRRNTLPEHLRLEDNPEDPGLCSAKQNHYLETGEIHYLHHMFPGMEESGFEANVEAGLYGERKDPKWTS